MPGLFNRNPLKVLPVFIAFVLSCHVMSGCAESDVVHPSPPTPPAAFLKPLNYCIQVGAFLNMDNAVRLMDKLNARGMDAYYFKHVDGFYKVRFGNYMDEASARETAAQLQAKGDIEAFIIIKPDDYAAARAAGQSEEYLREQLVNTALTFLGMPYHWGGSSTKQGFDCSGLTMTIYRLNGLDLDRTSKSQFLQGKPVDREAILPGDLVFFTTRKDRAVSHVGIYIGDDKFIHATTTGKQVRTDFISQTYYVKRFLGARTFI